jgi:hypothetical protein
MSKTQDKKAQRIADAQEFVAERRKMQLEILEQNYEVGVRIYEAQKDKLLPEEVEQIEAMKAEQRAALDKLREQINPGA